MRTKDFMQPRFSIRRLTISAVSVMFGAVIFGVSATQVKAAVQPEQKPQTEQVQPTKTDTSNALTATATATAAGQDIAAKTETVAKKVVVDTTQGNTTEKDASHATGLPADGKVKADLSISAKYKYGKTEEVSIASKDNKDKIIDGKKVIVYSKNGKMLKRT